MFGALVLILIMVMLTVMMALMTIGKIQQGRKLPSVCGLIATFWMVWSIADCIKLLN